MNLMSQSLKILSAILLASSITACGSDSDSSSDESPVAQLYPTSQDSFESGEGDNTEQLATQVAINTSYTKTLYPVLDIDWVSVELQANTEYEFSANKLCATCDTKIFVYEQDAESETGYTEIIGNDDYIFLDSAVIYTPEETGTYLVKVIPFNEDMGISTYTLNIHEYVDADEDSFSAYYDCNDGDNTIFPQAIEIVEDGIDQDCNGSDLMADDSQDAFESDNIPEQASNLSFLEYGYNEAIFIFQQHAEDVHTIHDIDDVDWVKFELPAFSAVELYFDYTNFTGDLTVFEADAETEVGVGFGIYSNDTDASKVYYIKVESDEGSIGYYLPTAMFLGYDKDRDGFYTMSWAGESDCVDDNAEINPQAVDVADDGIDSNCDGLDIGTEAQGEVF